MRESEILYGGDMKKLTNTGEYYTKFCSRIKILKYETKFLMVSGN